MVISKHFLSKRKNWNINTIIHKGFAKVGGITELIAKYSYAISSNTIYSNTTCGLPHKDYFDLHRGVDRDLPWTGDLLLY